MNRLEMEHDWTTVHWVTSLTRFNQILKVPVAPNIFNFTGLMDSTIHSCYNYHWIRDCRTGRPVLNPHASHVLPWCKWYILCANPFIYSAAAGYKGVTQTRISILKKNNNNMLIIVNQPFTNIWMRWLNVSLICTKASKTMFYSCSTLEVDGSIWSSNEETTRIQIK